MLSMKRVALAVAFLLAAAPAMAQCPTAVTVKVTRNLTSVAVKAIVQQDPDSSGSGWIEARWDGNGSPGTADTVFAMVRRPRFAAGGEVFEGRIEWIGSP